MNATTGRVIVGYTARVLNSRGGTLHKTPQFDTRSAACREAIAWGGARYGESVFRSLLQQRAVVLAPLPVVVVDPDQLAFL